MGEQTTTCVVFSLLICAVAAAAIPQELEDAADMFSSLSASEQQQILGSMSQKDAQSFVEALPQSVQTKLTDMIDIEDLEVELEDSDSEGSEDDRKDEDEGGCDVAKGEIFDNRIGACVKACTGNQEVAYDVPAFLAGKHYNTEGYADRQTIEAKYLPRYASCVTTCPSTQTRVMSNQARHRRGASYRISAVVPTTARCVLKSCTRTREETVEVCQAKAQMFKALDRNYNPPASCFWKCDHMNWQLTNRKRETFQSMTTSTCAYGNQKGKVMERSGNVRQGQGKICCKLTRKPSYECSSTTGNRGERVYEDAKTTTMKYKHQGAPIFAAYSLSSMPTTPTEGKAYTGYDFKQRGTKFYPAKFSRSSPVGRACLKWARWGGLGLQEIDGLRTEATAANFEYCSSKCVAPSGGEGAGLWSEKVEARPFRAKIGWKCTKWASGTAENVRSQKKIIYLEELPASTTLKGCIQGLAGQGGMLNYAYNSVTSTFSPSYANSKVREEMTADTKRVVRALELSAQQKNHDIKAGTAPGCLRGERLYV